MTAHRTEFRLSSMCRVLRVHRSGYYAWLAKPKSERTRVDEQILVTVRQSYANSNGIYGSPRVYRDVREAGIAG